MNPQTYIFIGRSGCGKGTQAEFLISYIKERDVEKRPVFYLETGPQFRDFITGDSYASILAKKVYEEDKRQPDFLAIWMWSHLLVEGFTGIEHLVMDGTPRSIAEALAIDTALGFYNRKATVIYLNVSRDWSEKRLLARGRADDATLKRITKRLDWFDSDVLPAVEHFRNDPQCNFIEVNGEQGKEKVHEEIVRRLKTFS